MLSLGLVKSVVNILEKLVFYPVDISLCKQLGIHHRRRPHSACFLLLFLWGDHAAIWRHRPPLEGKVNLDVPKIFENMLDIGSAFRPELVDGCLFH